MLPPGVLIGLMELLDFFRKTQLKKDQRKTKIGTEVAHVTRDSDTTFKVKRSKVKVTRPLYTARS